MTTADIRTELIDEFKNLTGETDDLKIAHSIDLAVKMFEQETHRKIYPELVEENYFYQDSNLLVLDWGNIQKDTLEIKDFSTNQDLSSFVIDLDEKDGILYIQKDLSNQIVKISYIAGFNSILDLPIGYKECLLNLVKEIYANLDKLADGLERINTTDGQVVFSNNINYINKLCLENFRRVY